MRGQTRAVNKGLTQASGGRAEKAFTFSHYVPCFIIWTIWERGGLPAATSGLHARLEGSALAILAVSPDMRAGLLRRRGVDIEMFLYGFAFLLIETKFVTAMNLLWGAIWLTSAVVFGAILFTILIGTVVMQLKPVPWALAGVGLVIALLTTYAIPLEALLRTDPPTRLALSVLYVAAPVIFASLIFAARFKVRPAADLAFGWNLLGAVVGGLAEFFSMALGFRAMTLVAITAYLLAFLVARRSPDGASPPDVESPAYGDRPLEVGATA